MNVIRKILLSFALVLISSCSVTSIVKDMYKDGEITKTMSQFDGTTQISMLPSCLYQFQKNDIQFCIGAYKTNKMEKDKIILEVEVPRAIGLNKMMINVDGNIYSYIAMDKISKHYIGSKRIAYNDINGYVSNRFTIPISIIKDIIKAKKAVARIYIKDNSYIEGSFIKTDYYSVKMKNAKNIENIIKMIDQSLKELLENIYESNI